MGTITRINTRLNLEWEAQHAHEKADHGTAGFITGDEYLAFLSNSDQATLRDCLQDAVSGNSTVERALLHYFQGMAVNAAHTCKGLRYLKSIGQQDEALTIAVHALWETIKTYPLQRTSSVTGNLQMEMLKRITRSVSAKLPQFMAEQTYGDFEIAESIHSESCTNATTEAHLMECRPHEESIGSPWIEVMRVLEWSVKTHILSVSEAKLLGQYTSATTKERHKLADEMAMSSSELSDKISVLKRRLARRLASAGVERGSLM